MRYYRCACGEKESWSSMGTLPCEGCSKCGTTLAESRFGHETPKPHKMYVEKVMVETDQGKIHAGDLTRCWWCLKPLAKIVNEPMELAEL